MRVKSISYAGKADVYNMEVEDTHSFVIQGGVISHNCADEVRYMCMNKTISAPKAKVPDPYNNSPLKLFLDIDKKDLPKAKPRQRMEIKYE